MDLKERIIEQSQALFYKWGVKSVSMDQVASGLSISKRTLYEVFKDKEALIFVVCEGLMDSALKEITSIVNDKNLDDLDILIQVSTLFREGKKGINPLFFEDIKRYHCQIYKNVIQSKKSQMDAVTIKLYQRAQQRGLLWSNLDVEFACNFLSDFIEKNEMRENNPELVKQVLKNIIYPYLRGICTPEGMALIKQTRLGDKIFDVSLKELN